MARLFFTLALSSVLVLALIAAGVAAATETKQTQEGEKLYFGMLTRADLDKLLGMVSKLISYGIIALSFTLKLPEIKNVLKLRSVEGLNRNALYFEIISYLFTVTYNVRAGNPLTVFAETIVITIQNLALAVLFWKFSNYEMGNRIRDGVAYLGLLATLVFLPSWVVPAYIQLSTAANIWARLNQIYANYRDGTTGVLSPITVTMQTAGTLARVFTCLQETTDFLLVGSFVVAFLLNLTILLQVLYYSMAKGEKVKAKADEKNQPKMVESAAVSSATSSPTRGSTPSKRTRSSAKAE